MGCPGAYHMGAAVSRRLLPGSSGQTLSLLRKTGTALLAALGAGLGEQHRVYIMIPKAISLTFQTVLEIYNF